MNNKKLYIIGNGFDLHHGLKTSYWNFSKFLCERNTTLHNFLKEYLISSDDMWSDFEANLAKLDIAQIMSDNEFFLPDFQSNDLKFSDYYLFPDIMRENMDVLGELKEEFQKFICEVIFPPSVSEKKITLDTEALFLNFNYTDTLERVYGIKRERINYIHNSANESLNIILGHGVRPSGDLDGYPEPPDDIDPEDYGQWYFDNTSYGSYEEGGDIMNEFFDYSFKDTESIINQNKIFFDRIRDVEEIIILGHSISSVDLPYFVKLTQAAKKDVKWIVSYYEKHQDLLHSLTNIGIARENITFIQIADIQTKNRQLKFDF